MSRKTEVTDLLKNSEVTAGSGVPFVVSVQQSGSVGDVQINVYTDRAGAHVRTFNLLDGLTPLKTKKILEWVEALAKA
jgi:hypothetical protein